jgi:hypothetical protein
MTVLQIHEEMAFAVMSFCPCLIGTKSLFESLDLTPKAVSKYFNKVRTGHKFVGHELGNAGITIIPEPFSDNWFLAKKAGSVKRVTEDLSGSLPQNEYRTRKQKEHEVHFFCDL